MQLRHIVLFSLCLFFADNVFSQIKKKDEKRRESVSLQVADTMSSYYQSSLFEFPNVNKVAYYRNEKEWKTLSELNRNKDWKTMYPLLKDYVAKFGIVNFYKDTYLIWRLAKITEMYGNFYEALLLYKLVLKHHRADIDIRSVELHYDSLNINETDYYVPLEYYYELVDFRSAIDTLRPPKSVLLNMGEAINSDWSDYGPSLGYQDQLLVFTSKRNSHYSGSGIEHDEDIFLVKKENDFWMEALEMKGINSTYNEGSATLSKDGRTLFFARCNSPDSYGDCDLFSATLGYDSLWTNVKNLGLEVNSRAWDSHPSLSHNEDTLYFASDRMGGFGLSDIYLTVRQPDGSWGLAQNAGPIINTRNSEVSPFYHYVYDVLYFSSNGQNLNFGEFDIYKSYAEHHTWSEPRNIGPLVNGPGSEFYFTIDTKSQDLYYARSTESNMDNMDLYSFPLPMEAQPGAKTIVKGHLKNEDTNEPFKGIVSIIDLDNGIEVAPKYLRPDGSFSFDLINHNNYLLIIQGDEFFRIEELFYLDGDMNINKVTSPISSKLKFASLEFPNGTSELSSDMYPDLDKIGNFLLDNPSFKLKISGHTDSDGREDFNLKLSQERADAIKEYLVFFGGIEEGRVEARGYGSSKPIVQEVTEENKKLNRRVEFEILRELINTPPDPIRN